MKKIFTLLVAVGLLTAAANAQTGSRDNRDRPQFDPKNIPQTDQRDNRQYDQRNDQQNDQWDRNNGYNDDRYYNANDFSRGGMQMQVARINRKYDLQAQRVKNDFFMRRFEKMRLLRSIEAQRQQEIRMLYARAGKGRDWRHDRGYDPRY